MMQRFSFLFVAIGLTLSSFQMMGQSTALRKAKVADQLEAIQQVIMNLQNVVRDVQETGHCRGCQNQITLLEHHMAGVAWFLVAQKPNYVRSYLAPTVSALHRWMEDPSSVPNVHQMLGDLMTRTAYEFLLMGELDWDEAFWEKAKSSWPTEKASLGFSNSAMMRAEKNYQLVLKGH